MFANDVIEKEMKKMNAGADALEDEDEDVLSELDEEEGSDFFDGEEDLQDVNVNEADDDEEEEQEMNVSGDDDEEIEEIEYGGEDDDEEEEADDDIFQKPSGAKKKEKAPKKSIFADYEEFAHLLEGDLYDGEKKRGRKHEAGPRVGKRPRK